MEMTLKTALIALGALIIIAIVLDGWRRLQKGSQTNSPTNYSNSNRNRQTATDVGLDPLFAERNTAPSNQHGYSHHNTNNYSSTTDYADPDLDGDLDDTYSDTDDELEYLGNNPALVQHSNSFTPNQNQQVPASQRHSYQRLDQEHTTVALEKKGGDMKLREMLLVFHVVARAKPTFDGPHLLQALLSLGLKHGEMSIFHRHQMPNGKGPIEFSVASMAEPGIFDLDTIGSFSTPGLSLFLCVPGPVNPLNAVDLMLETADKLALRLGGEVLDHDLQPLSVDALEDLRAEVAEVCRHNEAVKRDSVI